MRDQIESTHEKAERITRLAGELEASICGIGALAACRGETLETARQLLDRLYNVITPGFLHHPECDLEDLECTECRDLVDFRKVMRGWTPQEGSATAKLMAGDKLPVGEKPSC